MAPAAPETPESIGPYRILGPLGRGGMGVVYRGVHRGNGQEAAVKTVREARGEILDGLRREIHALSRMRHPGIVRVLDSGLEDGAPWYAMELLEGVTLRAELRGWFRGPLADPQPTESATPAETRLVEALPSEAETPDKDDAWWTFSLVSRRTRPAEARSSGAEPKGAEKQPLVRPMAAAGRLHEALTLLRRLCEPLAFLHGEGIVHRDLKPENVLLRAAGPEAPPGTVGMPVLVDFGLVARWPMAGVGGAAGRSEGRSRESLDITAQGAGTLAYMAPEQLRGELLDARADLYSLGCMLYEMLTGRRPFVADSESSLAQAHLKMEPVAPSRLVEGVDPALDELTLSLLAKDPRRRLGFADAVAEVLGRLGAEATEAQERPRTRAYLYRPGFAGRAEPLAALIRWAEEGRRGRGAVLLLGGESGVGKTRLALELGRRVGAWGTLVLAGGAAPEAGGEVRQAAPLGVLRGPLQAVADHCRGGGEEAGRLLGGRLRLLGTYEPAMLELPGAEAEPELAVLPAAAARLRLFQGLSETFLALTRGGPVVVLLDDLQNADELSLSWLGALVRSRGLEQAPLFVLGTYRSTEVRGELGQLLEQPGVGQLTLGRIEGEAVGSMVGDMLALFPPPRGLVEFLERQSEGNPFFVAEYLRAAVELGLLGRDAQGMWQVAERGTGGWDGLALPASLRELVQEHLSGLGDNARRLAEVAAVLGREVEAEGLQAVAGVSSEEVLEALQELLRRQVLEDPGVGPLRFSHDKLREIAYEGLHPRERRRLHRRTAEVLEAAHYEPGREPWARLAHHRQQAGAPARARKHFLAAARQAVARYALGEAEQLYRAYLELVRKPSAESLAARNELGHAVLLRRGRTAEAQREHEVAIAEARRVQDRRGEGVGLYRLAAVLTRAGNLPRARQICMESIERLRVIGAQAELGEALLNLGGIELEMGDYEAAQSRLREGLELNRETGATALEGVCVETLGVAAWKQGRLDEAWTLWQQALEVHRRSGNRLNEGTVLRNLAALASMQGRSEEGRGLLMKALGIFREIGARREEGVALTNLGVIAWELDQREESEACYQQALELQRSIGDSSSEGLSLHNLAALVGERGELEKARELYCQALEIFREIGERHYEASVLRDQAILERRLGPDLAVAEAMLQESRSIFEAMRNDLECARCQCELGHLQLACGFSAREELLLAEALAGRLQGPTPHELQAALDRLKSAIRNAEPGREPLHRGERLQDLPAPLRRRFDAGRVL